MPLAATATAIAGDATRRHRRRRGGIVGGGGGGNPTLVPVYSTSADRSSPAGLQDAVLSGDVAIHLLNTDPEIARVMFHVNSTASNAQIRAWAADLSNPDPDDDGFGRGDSVVWFDLLGGPPTAANMWDTTLHPITGAPAGDQTWTLDIGVRYADGSTDVVTITFSTDNDSGAIVLPAVPTSIAGEAPNDYEARWQWPANATGVGGVDDAAGYKIRVATTSPPSGATPVDVGTTLNYLRTGLTADVTYYGQVLAYDADGDESTWSSPVAVLVTGEGSGLDSVTSWVQFFPAGNGVDPQPNALLAGTHKGIPLENVSGLVDEVQYGVRGAWSSPGKVNTNFANSVGNGIFMLPTENQPNPAHAVGIWERMNDEHRLRKAQHPDNGGFGSQCLANPDFGGMLDVNFVLTQRKHSGKHWVKNNSTGLWGKTNINNKNKATLGYTPGLPNGTTFAEDSAVAAALTLSGILDSKLQALAIELVDNRTGGAYGQLEYGAWAERVFMRFAWECFGPWSSDYAGIDPNMIGSNKLQTAANGGYGLTQLTSEAKAYLGALADAGDPKVETFVPAAAYDGIPGWHEIAVGDPNPDRGTGGDKSVLFAAAYAHVFDVVANEMADRCDFRGVPTRLPIMCPNMPHPGADPTSDDDGDAGPAGWRGSGSAPDGGDLYQPLEVSRTIHLGFLDGIGRDRMAMLNVDAYGRNKLFTEAETEVPLLRDYLVLLASRYRRPISSSEFGVTARGNKDTAPFNGEKLAAFFKGAFDPIDGLWASVPTCHVVHYLPDGNSSGVDRYRIKKELDDTGAANDTNPWWLMMQYFPGRGIAPADFVGLS